MIDAINTVRGRHPDWPMIVAQTCLHEGYSPGTGHIIPYPFGRNVSELAAHSGVPQDLVRSLAFQQRMFENVKGRGPIVFVPIDFTHEGDGYDPPDYGVDALAEALVRVAPQAMTVALSAIPALAHDKLDRAADPIVMGYAMAAAGSDLFPVAGAVAVTAIQTRLLQRLGQIYEVEWDRRTMMEFGAALGSGVVARTLAGFGLRQLAKLIPVYGQTAAAAASAAMSFAVTFALGKAAIYFLRRRSLGVMDKDGVAATYQRSLREALRLAKACKLSENEKESQP